MGSVYERVALCVRGEISVVSLTHSARMESDYCKMLLRLLVDLRIRLIPSEINTSEDYSRPFISVRS